MSARKPRPYPNVQWRDGIAYLVVKIDGQRIRESLHTSNWNEAVERREKRLQELKNKEASRESCGWQTPGAAPVGYSRLREYADERIERARDRKCAAITVKWGEEHQWKHLCAMFPTVDLITEDAVAGYYYARLRAGYAHNSVKRDIPLLREASRWAHRRHRELEVVDWKVPARNKREALAAQAGEAKPVAFVRKWWAALKPERQAQAALFMCAGMRMNEVLRVQPSWLEPSGTAGIELLRIPASATKDGRRRVVGIPQIVATLVREHMPTAANPRKHFNTVAKALGHGDTLHARDLRHTFKVELSRHAPIAVQLVMGHKHLEGTAGDMYQHLTDADAIKVAEHAAELWWS